MVKQHEKKTASKTQRKEKKTAKKVQKKEGRESTNTVSQIQEIKKNRVQEIKKFLIEINQEFFIVMLVTYLVLLLLEELREGFVSYYFNPNILLSIVIISGIITAFWGKAESAKRKEAIMGKDYLLIFILGIIGAAVIFFKIRELGYLSYIISIVAGALIILLSILLLSEEEAERNSPSK